MLDYPPIMDNDMTALLEKLTELRDSAREGRVRYQRLHEESCRRLDHLEQLAMLQRLDDIERRLTRLEVTSASR